MENSDIDIANYAVDNKPYACSSDRDFVINKLQENTERSLRWSHNNNLTSIAGKSHLIVFSKKNLEIQVSSCFIKIECSDFVISKLQENTERSLRWSHNNNLTSIAGKSHLTVFSKKNLEIQVSSCFIKIECSDFVISKLQENTERSLRWSHNINLVHG